MQFTPESRALLRQFFHFAAVGLSGTSVQYLTLWIGVSFLSLPAAAASGIGYILGSVVNYILNYFFTFKSGKSHKETAAKYFSVLGVGWCINVGLMSALVHHLHWNIWLAQVITTGIALLWHFAGSRWWAFKHDTSKIGTNHAN
jgi:putative flippase GtrA